ncbi:MAG: sigma-54-dependent transcriptional regulator [Pirellulales bacterium]
MAHLLIVDDEQSICWAMSKLALELGHSASVAASAEQAFESAAQRKPDAIVLDVRLPGMDGLTAMGSLQEQVGDVPIIVITAYGELSTAVQAVRNGAFEYLVKPFDLSVAQRAIQRALEKPRPDAGGDAAPSYREIVGSSGALQEVFKRIAVVAPSEACVHLRGESGTGKELIARAIHRYSRRAEGPFVAVNVASLNPSLAESELFGHARGAFTGAEHSHKGLLEQADGGTLFLDEVADIPLSVQVKLLRVLEFGEIVPVGGDRPLRSDFRLLSATHQNLARKVADGSFREDLYFRLITFEIAIPPLRERREDIADLTEHFLGTLAAKNGCPRPVLPTETLRVLGERPWYGNVRELRNALEHAVILARGGCLTSEHLPVPLGSPTATRLSHEDRIAALVREWAERQMDESPSARDLHQRLLRLVEPPLLRAVLDKHHGQYVAAARHLGLHRVTVKRRLEESGEDAG